MATVRILSGQVQALQRKEKLALHNYCKNLYYRNENVRGQFYSQWFETIAMLQDQHYSEYVDGAGLTETPRAFGDYVYRAVINKMIGAHQGLIAKTIKARPRPTVIPLNADSLSIDVVRFMKQLDEFLEIKLHRNRVRMEALAWMYATGTGITKSFYDEFAGDNIELEEALRTDDPDNIGIEDSDLASVSLPIWKRLNQGEIYYGSRSPFEVGFDMSNQVRSATSYYYEQQALTATEFRERYPETWRNVKAASSFDKDKYDQWKDKLREFIGNSGGLEALDVYSTPANSRNFGEDIKVIEVYHKPSAIWPKGLMVHWTPNAGDDGILAVGESPFTLKTPDGRTHIYAWNPYTFYDDIIIPGKPLARATIESGKSPNKMLNRNVSSVQEFVNICAKHRVIVRRGMGLDRNAFSDRAFDIIEIGAGDLKEDISQMPTPQLPAQVTDQRNYMNNEFDVLVGQTLEEEGRAVRSNLSGDAIELLDAMQQVKMIPKIDNYVEGMCLDSRLHALLAKQHYPSDVSENRYLTIAGRTGQHRVRLFDESLIAIDAKFYVVAVSDLTRNVAVKKIEAMKMYSAGVFGEVGSEEARKRLLKTQEFGNIEEVYEDTTAGEALVNDRLDAILDDMPPTDDGPWVFENHQEAIELINKWRLKYYGKVTPIQRQRVDYLVVEHQRLMSEIEQAGMDEQEEVAGRAAQLDPSADPTSPSDVPSTVAGKGVDA